MQRRFGRSNNLRRCGLQCPRRRDAVRTEERERESSDPIAREDAVIWLSGKLGRVFSGRLNRRNFFCGNKKFGRVTYYGPFSGRLKNIGTEYSRSKLVGK